MSLKQLVPTGVYSAAAAPTSPAVGDTYFDTTLGYLRTWSGTVWAAGPPDSGSAENILLNGSFEVWGNGTTDTTHPFADPANWSSFWGTAPTLRSIITQGVGYDGALCVRIEPRDSAGSNQYLISSVFPTRAGENWYVSVWARKPSGAGVGQINGWVLSAPHSNPQYFDGTTHGQAAFTLTAIPLGSTYVLYEGNVTIPSGDTYARLSIQTVAADATPIIEFDQAIMKSLSPPASSLVPYPKWDSLTGTVGAAAGSTAALGLPYPGGTSLPDGPAQIKALADAVDAIIRLPSPVVASGPNNNNMTGSGSFANLTTSVAASLVLAKPCWVRIDFGAWHSVTGTLTQDARLGVALSGSVTQAAGAIGGAESHGLTTTFVRSTTSGAAINANQGGSIEVLSPAGTLTATLQGLRNGPPSVAEANYATVRLTPMYWD